MLKRLIMEWYKLIVLLLWFLESISNTSVFHILAILELYLMLVLLAFIPT